MSEVWEYASGHEHMYKVSNQGRVMNYIYKRILKPRKRTGYLYVRLSNGIEKKECAVHRLVALAFCSPKTESLAILEVNHKNGIRTDNRAENLEWVSHAENIKHAFYVLGKNNAGKNNVKRVQCVETGVVYESVTSAAISLGKSKSYLSQCLNGKIKTVCGYHWKFIQ